MKLKSTAVMMLFFLVSACCQSHARHLFTNHLFLLGDRFEVHILGENQYSLSGVALETVREQLVNSVHEEWDDEGNNGSDALVATVSLKIYSGKGQKESLALRVDVRVTMFSSGKKGYDAFVEAVRKSGLSKRGNNGVRSEDGWKIEGNEK